MYIGNTLEKQGLVSVIVPLYNKESWIERCIQSILNQTYSELQILVINDGSTDDSRKVVEAINDSRVQIIDKFNGGVSSARNLGIEIAEGDFITFIDADDEWNHKHIEVLIEGFLYYPEATLMANRFDDMLDVTLEESNNSLGVHYDSVNYLYLLSKGVFPIHIGSTMFKKTIIDTHGLKFYEHMKIGEDINFLIKNSLIGECVITDYIGLIYHRDDEQSAMNKKKHEALLTPLYLCDVNYEKQKLQVQQYMKQFLINEYYKKAYQNRGLSINRKEFSVRIAGVNIGYFHIMVYSVIRFFPKLFVSVFKKIKNYKGQ